ncbi:GDP-L-fucose synthase family protein [Candidatus Seribacter sulfatis]|uniref:GDP-L-fucose synthase family protein n=1 Tax=Candidatus Seribacter sulfatis TaxID=3381756 RepID=UPI00389AD2D5
MKKVFVSGHNGMVGSALIRAFKSRMEEYEIITRNRTKLDLCNQLDVHHFLSSEKPDIVINAAGRVGGIYANNTFPADFIRENLLINTNLIHTSYEVGVTRFLNLGSSCIYPREAEQPLKEESLLTGPLEPTNSAYALAKIAGLEMCRHYRKQYGVLFHSAMPTNLYGPGDNYHAQNSHVLPALIRRFHEAKKTGQSEVCIWGTGKPRRELLHADDLADALLFLLSVDNPPDWINVGTGRDQTILELANLVKDTTGFVGEITHDLTKEDGTPVKRLDVSLLDNLGWKARISLEQGLKSTYGDFLRCEENNSLRI